MPNPGEVAVWTYPWNLLGGDAERTCGELADDGVDTVSVAAHYHSVRSVDPRAETPVATYPGGAYVDPTPGRFEATPVSPAITDVDGSRDPVADAVSAAHAAGLSAAAWTVCLHNTRLAATNPEYRAEGAFGRTPAPSLCPSYPAVREYYARVVEAVVGRGVDEIQLESLGFPTVLHPHGRRHGHVKCHVPLGTTGEALLSQCFCAGCRAGAVAHGVDVNVAIDTVRSLVRRSLAGSHTLDPLESLADEQPSLGALLDYRRATVRRFVETVADAAGDVPCTYYAMEWPGSEPADLRAAGVDLGTLRSSLDRTMAMCYVADPAAAVARVDELADSVAGPVDAGVTLSPAVLDDPTDVERLAEALDGTEAERLSLYHHGIADDARRAAIRRAAGVWG